MGLCSSSSKEAVSLASPSDFAARSVYSVVVFVAQALNVKKMDMFSESDAYVSVKIGNQRKRTKVRYNSSHPIWNQNLKFDFKGDEKPTTVEFVVKDKDFLKSDDLIGTASRQIGSWGSSINSTGNLEYIDVKDKKGAVTARLQVSIRAFNVTKDLRRKLASYDYSHLLEVTVAEGRSIAHRHGQDFFVEVGWGANAFKTRVSRGPDPVWRSRCFFWCNKRTQRHYKLKFAVMDHDDMTRNDSIGTAYLEANEVLSVVGSDSEDKGEESEAAPTKNILQQARQKVAEVAEAVGFGKSIDRWLHLGSDVKSDKDLARRNSLSVAEDDDDEVSMSQWKEEDQGLGQLRVTVRAIPREQVEHDFFKRIFETFDANGDHRLQRHEVATIISTLGLEKYIDQQRFETQWSVVDTDNDGELSEDEAQLLLRSIIFLNAEAANRLLVYAAYGEDGLRKCLVEPVEDSKDCVLDVMDRATGLVVKENIPTYIRTALNIMFGSKFGRAVATGHRVQSIMHKLSVNQGKKYDSEESRADIQPFVHLHGLRLEEVEKPVSEYKTFNEFFARALKAGARPIAAADDDSVAVCPADCRMMVFKTTMDATQTWIKGDKYTMAGVLGPRASELVSTFENGSMVIARLAPQDYHRWHFPVAGKVTRMTPIDGTLYTVNPLAITRNVNVYTENKRVIVEIDSTRFGKVILVAVGATMVGSIEFFVKVGATVSKGQQHGCFRFGGSTCLVYFQPGVIHFDPDLLRNSENKMETLVRVNTSLGKAAK